jgi:lysophospholipase L1-like esterase
MRRLTGTFYRYVAIGDSSTEGIDDPAPNGGWRGWSRRLAQRIAEQGSLEYANFGVRGRTTREIKDEQLLPALALEPDLVTCFSGTNDVIRPRFDLDGVLADMRHVQRACVASGAVVLTFTLPDLTPLLPLARLLAPRIRAMNAGLRRLCADTGVLLVDFAQHPIVATDSRLWSDDRLHANAAGHARIADALAEALGLPGSSGAWREPLPALPPSGPWQRLSGEAAWVRRHLLPWCWLGLTRGGASVRTPAHVTTLERVESAWSTTTSEASRA